MSEKIKVIFKRNRETPACVMEIENTLAEFQRLVEGPIEPVSVNDFAIICNEEGRLRGMPENAFGFVGPIVICGIEGEEFTGLDETVLEYFKMVLAYGGLS